MIHGPHHPQRWHPDFMLIWSDIDSGSGSGDCSDWNVFLANGEISKPKSDHEFMCGSGALGRVGTMKKRMRPNKSVQPATLRVAADLCRWAAISTAAGSIGPATLT